VGEASSAAKAGIGAVGESTTSKRRCAATAASRIAPIWLKPRNTSAPFRFAPPSTQRAMKGSTLARRSAGSAWKSSQERIRQNASMPSSMARVK
jgi:hypothetical protein